MCLAVCGLQDTESSCCHNVRPISRSIARSANFYLLSGDVLANYSHPQRAGRAIRCQTQQKKKCIEKLAVKNGGSEPIGAFKWNHPSWNVATRRSFKRGDYSHISVQFVILSLRAYVNSFQCREPWQLRQFESSFTFPLITIKSPPSPNKRSIQSQ